MSKYLLFGVLSAVYIASFGCSAGEDIRVVDQPDTEATNDFYVSNRPPLTPSPFMKLPIGAIKPQGWVRRQLELEAEGFTGNLLEISRSLKKENNAWLSTKGQGHSPCKDKFNKVSFDAVETKSIRLDVQLQPDFSAGILEWQVNTEN